MELQVNSELIKRIARYSEIYEKKFLDIGVKILQKDWYEALKFFFSKAFLQGRRDEVSNMFFRNTLEFIVA